MTKALQRAFFSWCIFLIGAYALFSQRAASTWEIGLALYGTNYSGDLAPDHISMSNMRGGVGLFARYHLSKAFQFRSGLNALLLAGDDRFNPPNSNRSFRFQSTLIELCGQIELLLANIVYEPIGKNQTYYFIPYVRVGAGLAWFSPQVTYYGPESDRPRYEREPLPEGGRNQHTALVLPFGLGLRWVMSDRVTFSVEADARPAPTDLLDGVSANGNPKRKDWYYTAGIGLSYTLNPSASF